MNKEPFIYYSHMNLLSLVLQGQQLFRFNLDNKTARKSDLFRLFVYFFVFTDPT